MGRPMGYVLRFWESWRSWESWLRVPGNPRLPIEDMANSALNQNLGANSCRCRRQTSYFIERATAIFLIGGA